MTNGTAPDEEYISVEEARKVLRVSARQVQRHAAAGRVRSRQEGRRLLVHAGDVKRLAQELGAESRPTPAHEGELVPDSGEFMAYVRDLQSQLLVMTRRVGELEGQLGSRLLPVDEAMLRQELVEAQRRAQELEEEAERLRTELEQAQRPWWRRLRG